MMPTLALPGEMIPGQFGPMSRVSRPCRARPTRTMSRVGIPSVMHTMTRIPASAASRMASAAKAGGTKINEVLAPSLETAAITVSKTGIPSWTIPPFPGVTPATTCVPYSRHARAWNVPSLPVTPCTTTRVLLSTRMLMRAPFPSAAFRTPSLTQYGGDSGGHPADWREALPRLGPREGSRPSGRAPPEAPPLSCRPGGPDSLLGAVLHAVGRDEVQAGLRQHLLPELDVRPLHPDHDGELHVEGPHGLDDPLCQPVAAEDPPEDVDQNRPNVPVGDQDAEGVLDLLGAGPAPHVQEVGGLAPGELDDVQ